MEQETKVIDLKMEKPVINRETRMDKQVNIYKLFMHVLGEPEQNGAMVAFGYERSKLIEYYNSCLATEPYTDKDGVKRYFKEGTDLYVMSPISETDENLTPNKHKHGIHNQWISESVEVKAIEDLTQHFRPIF